MPSGQPSPTPLAYYDPASSSLKTCQGSLFEENSHESCLILPRSGSMRNGRVFRRPEWTRHTAASGSSSLLPTPTVRDYKGKSARNQRQLADGSMSESACRNNLLPNAVEHLLPTPRASDGEKGGPNQRGSSGDLMLPSAVMLLPTPTVTDAKGGRNATAGRTDPNSQHHSGQTLTDVFWTGPDTSQPSGGGKPSSDDERQPQLF